MRNVSHSPTEIHSQTHTRNTHTRQSQTHSNRLEHTHRTQIQNDTQTYIRIHTENDSTHKDTHTHSQREHGRIGVTAPLWICKLYHRLLWVTVMLFIVCLSFRTKYNGCTTELLKWLKFSSCPLIVVMIIHVISYNIAANELIWELYEHFGDLLHTSRHSRVPTQKLILGRVFLREKLNISHLNINICGGCW